MGVFTLGVRLHDLEEGPVEQRLRRAAELGFSCVQLPCKVLYGSYGIDRTGLTPKLAAHLRDLLEELGLHVAVLGCYQNVACPDAARRDAIQAEFNACFAFAEQLGGCPVGTETGRPNTAMTIDDERFGEAALERLIANLTRVCALAEARGGRVLIEPGWNEVACTPERCRAVLDAVASPALGVIFDPVSLLHPSLAGDAANVTARMLDLCGDRIEVLHAKDFEVVDDEDKPEWCDGTGSRLVCHGAGACGTNDFTPIARWAAQHHPGIDTVIENSTPATVERCRDYLNGLA